MKQFTKLFGDVLLFVYHCFDRIVILGHLPLLTRPENIVHFFRDVHGIGAITKEVLRQRTDEPTAPSTTSSSSWLLEHLTICSENRAPGLGSTLCWSESDAMSEILELAYAAACDAFGVAAVSNKAAKRMRQSVRRWRLHRHNDLALQDIADWVRPILSGWVRYFLRLEALSRWFVWPGGGS